MDVAIIERARSGDEEAFVLIYEHFSPQIHRYVYRLVGSLEQADDITQDTFLRAFQGIGKIATDSNVSAWLYRIASNAAFDILRRRKLITWMPIHEESDKSGEFTSEDFTPQVIESDIVRRAVTEMPPALAVCLVLRSVEGFSCEEIAEILKIPKGTVFSRLARARESFQQIYTDLARSTDVPNVKDGGTGKQERKA
ncbi:MAG TPA: sigma-70 family RNA polymerase sigma factor [Chloroflexia bacterium]|nr:sigma-70 family RNA polymerase sigma factor [Chloroflexia bacterium]